MPMGKSLMKRTFMFAALALAAVPALAETKTCTIDSDYDVALSPEAITFSRDDGTPRSLVMHDGSLLIDGREAALNNADRERVRQFEHDARALLPEVRAITLEAVEIAFTAMTEVARGLAPDNAKLQAKLEDSRAELLAQFDQPEGHFKIDEDAVAASVTRLVGEITPTLVGEITAAALSAAFSGDESKAKAIEQRAENMEADIEAKVKVRADALEARAELLCPKFVALDELENTLAYRLDDGSALDLLRAHR
jgi:maltose-binding protein MalE